MTPSCPSCARPVAMVKDTCIYCGGALSPEVLQAAAMAAQRVLEAKRLGDLESAARGLAEEQPSRRYVVIDTAEAAIQDIVAACSVSLWEAGQWRAASRYHLVKVVDEPLLDPLVSRLRENRLRVLVMDAKEVTLARNPIFLESIETSRTPVACTLRDDVDAPARRRDLKEQDLVLIVSASIRREKVKEVVSLKKVPDTRLEDALILHLHLRGEPRPWEIDPRRIRFEGSGLASGHMRTLQLARRLAESVPHDEGFRNVVPALAPGIDPLTEFTEPKPGRGAARRESAVVVMDNLSQFREYSAWRGVLAAGLSDHPAPGS